MILLHLVVQTQEKYVNWCRKLESKLKNSKAKLGEAYLEDNLVSSTELIM